MQILTEERVRQSDERLCLKTQSQTLIRAAMDGAGMTPWEARVLPDLVEDIYFQSPTGRPFADGQVRYQCTAIEAGAGVALADCAQVGVALQLFSAAEDRAVQRAYGVAAVRRMRICRVTEEAREQGGLLTQEDLSLLLNCDERTIRRDVAALKKQGIHVATRGYLKDIGPSVSHKGVAIQHWLQGEEPVAVARRINHSLKAVERYIEGFRRVALVAEKGLNPVEIARATKLSESVVGTYLALYTHTCQEERYRYRFDEIRLLSDAPEPAPAGKKGAFRTIRCPSVNGSPT